MLVFCRSRGIMVGLTHQLQRMRQSIGRLEKEVEMTCHLDAILPRIHSSILCQQLLKIKSTKMPTSRAIERSKPTALPSVSHLFIFFFYKKVVG